MDELEQHLPCPNGCNWPDCTLNGCIENNQMDSLEREFFEDKDFWGYLNSFKHRRIVAKAASSLCKEKCQLAWRNGWYSKASGADGESSEKKYLDSLNKKP